MSSEVPPRSRAKSAPRVRFTFTNLHAVDPGELDRQLMRFAYEMGRICGELSVDAHLSDNHDQLVPDKEHQE